MRPARALAALLAVTLLLPPSFLQGRPTASAGKGSSIPQAPTIIDNNDRMNVNNLDMFVTNHGTFAYDVVTGNGELFYPRGTTSSVVFAAGLWVGARVNGEPRVTVAEYGWEYTPGYMRNGTFWNDLPEFRNYRIE